MLWGGIAEEGSDMAGWLKKLFGGKPKPAQQEGWGPPKGGAGTKASGSAAEKAAGAEDGGEPGTRLWIAVFRSIAAEPERAKVDAFTESLVTPESRKLYGTNKLGKKTDDMMQVMIDQKRAEPNLLEQLAADWFRRLAREVKPKLGKADYWGLSFPGDDGSQRQLLMAHGGTGHLEASTVKVPVKGKASKGPLTLS